MTNPTKRIIPGTPVFDGDAASGSYGLNAMCYSFNKEENRNAFVADEAAYCRRYHLTDEQTKLIAARDVLGLVKAGGNIYYLAKLAGILGLNVQDVGALQTGVSIDEFKAKLLAYAQED